MKVPGSDSSAFTTRYEGFTGCLGMNDHFTPAGNPAPPRPRNPDFLTSSTSASGPIEIAFGRRDQTPRFIAASIVG